MITKTINLTSIIAVNDLNTSGIGRIAIDTKMCALVQSYLDHGDDVTQGTMSIRAMPDNIDALETIANIRDHFRSDKALVTVTYIQLRYRVTTIYVMRVLDGWAS